MFSIKQETNKRTKIDKSQDIEEMRSKERPSNDLIKRR